MMVIRNVKDILEIKNREEVIYKYVEEYFDYIYQQLTLCTINKESFSLVGGYDGNGEIYIVEAKEDLDQIINGSLVQLMVEKKILWGYRIKDKQKWYRGDDINEYYVIGAVLTSKYCNNIIIPAGILDEDIKVVIDENIRYTEYIWVKNVFVEIRNLYYKYDFIKSILMS